MTVSGRVRVRVLAAAVACLPALAAAQEPQVDHPTSDHATMEHSTTDHATMQHPRTEQPQGGHPKTDDPKTDHPQMDHSQMDHSQVDHSQFHDSRVDHSQMDRGAKDRGAMDHGATDHSRMHDGAHDAGAPPLPAITNADRRAAFPVLTGGHATHDDAIHHYLLFGRLEASESVRDSTPLAWEIEGWLGTDIHRLWLRSEGERDGGDTHAADVELLYGRSVSAWWDVVAGMRHAFLPADGRTWVAVGLQGLAPQMFEVQATAYIGESGRTRASAELEYELLLTNRLILQPVVEATWYGDSDPARGIGAGLSTMEAGLRLRYEITRRIAPYIGLVHERAFGDTADLRREAGDDTRDTRVVAGVRAWF